MRLLCLRTVFRPPVITIGGNVITADRIQFARLIRTAENMPIKGIVQSELIVALKTDLTVEPNALVTVKTGGEDQLEFSEHFISRISRRGGLLEIHAMDRMRVTENDFDDSLYNRSNEPYVLSLVLADLASQCGFAGFGGGNFCTDKIYFEELHGKKCREILAHIAENTVGAFYCSNDNRLKFTPFLSASCSIGMEDSRSEKMYLHSEKGPFTAVYCKNTVTNEVYGAGQSDSFRNVLKISGRLMDKTRVTAVLGAVAQKSYRSFSCGRIAITGAPEGLTEFIFTGHESGLISARTVVHFTGKGAYAEARAADICEDESDYTDLTGYELRKRIEEGRKYGCTVMTERGIGFVEEGDELRAGSGRFFSALSDRITQFDGVMFDGIMPEYVQSVSDTVKKIKYGGSVYVLSFKSEGGKKTDITFAKEESS